MVCHHAIGIVLTLLLVGIKPFGAPPVPGWWPVAAGLLAAQPAGRFHAGLVDHPHHRYLHSAMW